MAHILHQLGTATDELHAAAADGIGVAIFGASFFSFGIVARFGFGFWRRGEAADDLEKFAMSSNTTFALNIVTFLSAFLFLVTFFFVTKADFRL